LLRTIVEEAKRVRREITHGALGGSYFEGLTNPPVSHFSVTPALEKVLSSLELNFLVSKYHEMRNKDGQDVTIYALSCGLCEAERLPWGYPSGRRDDRSYFVQRCFDYTRVIHQFLSENQTIRCDNCAACFNMDQREKFEFYKWRCPDCDLGRCRVLNLGEEFRKEVAALDEKVMLDPVELQILETLHDEQTRMRAGEISTLLDTTYQLVGKRTEKLRDMGLVDKERIDGFPKSEITDRAESIYFRSEVIR
jgi:DNA-binding transcriptional ArsR family regulator